VLIERYGNWRDNTLCFTMMNTSETTRTVSVTVDLEGLGVNPTVGNLKVFDLVRSEEISGMVSNVPPALRFSLEIAPQEVCAIAIEREKRPPVAWLLQ
jgi:hypothetical protein